MLLHTVSEGVLSFAGGGASGSATLETLMDRLPLRAKPKIADLTSDRKLADRVRGASQQCSSVSVRNSASCCAHSGQPCFIVNRAGFSVCGCKTRPLL